MNTSTSVSNAALPQLLGDADDELGQHGSSLVACEIESADSGVSCLRGKNGGEAQVWQTCSARSYIGSDPKTATAEKRPFRIAQSQLTVPQRNAKAVPIAPPSTSTTSIKEAGPQSLSDIAFGQQ
jgi:hypothetical protein